MTKFYLHLTFSAFLKYCKKLNDNDTTSGHLFLVVIVSESSYLYYYVDMLDMLNTLSWIKVSEHLLSLVPSIPSLDELNLNTILFYVI